MLPNWPTDKRILDAKELLEKEWFPKPYSDEMNEALEILVIDTWIQWHHTDIEFKKVEMNNMYIWSLTVKLDSLPSRFKNNNTCHLIMSPENADIALKSNFWEFKRNQLSLVDTETDYLEAMKKVQSWYKTDRALMWEYMFSATLSKLNRSNNTVTFIISSEVALKLEELAKAWKDLKKFILIIQEV